MSCRAAPHDIKGLLVLALQLSWSAIGWALRQLRHHSGFINPLKHFQTASRNNQDYLKIPLISPTELTETELRLKWFLQVGHLCDLVWSNGTDFSSGSFRHPSGTNPVWSGYLQAILRTPSWRHPSWTGLISSSGMIRCFLFLWQRKGNQGGPQSEAGAKWWIRGIWSQRRSQRRSHRRLWGEMYK